jgi:hypothetical protein
LGVSISRRFEAANQLGTCNPARKQPAGEIAVIRRW